MTYISLADLKLYLGITTTNEDDLLNDCISAAQKTIETKCGRVFEAAANTTRNFDAVRDVEGYLLHLDADLCAINSITNGDGLVVSSSNYVTEPRNITPYYAIRLKANSSVAWTYSSSPEDAIAVSGKWAYSVTAPDDIAQACKRLAAWLYRQKDSSQDADRAIMSASGAVIMPSALPKDVVDLYKPYIRQN